MNVMIHQIYRARIRTALLAGSLLLGVCVEVTASPPTPPWVELEREARAHRIDAVRARYRTKIEHLLNRVESAPDHVTPETLPARLLDVGTLIEYTASWAQAEGQAAFVERGPGEAFNDQVLSPMLQCVNRVVASRTRLVAAAAHLGRRMDRAARSRLRWAFDGLQASSSNQDHLGRRMARLVKVTEHTQHLDALFARFGGRIGAFDSPHDFIDHAHDFDMVYRPAAATRSRAIHSALDAETREAALEVARQYFAAYGQASTTSVRRLFAASDTADAEVSRMTESGVSDVDISQAALRVYPSGPQELRVRLQGPVKITMQDGEVRAYNGGQMLRMAVLDGEPRIVDTGAGQ